MTPCAVKDCDRTAHWIVERDNVSRLACKRHAAEARKTGYSTRFVANPAPAQLEAALAGLRSRAEQRRRAEDAYWRQFQDARTLGASYAQLGAAGGLNPPNARHHVQRLHREETTR